MSDETPDRVRLRIVMDATFVEADPSHPSGYGDLLLRWAESLETNPVVPCTDVTLREILTIGTSDDYTDWRNPGGAYDVAKLSESATIRFERPKKRERDIE